MHAQRAARRPRERSWSSSRAAGPDRVGGALAGAGVGRVVAVRGERDPRAPRPPRGAPRTSTRPEPRTPIRSKRRGRGDAARAPAVEVARRDGQPEAARARTARRERGQRAKRPEQRPRPAAAPRREGAPAGDRRAPHRAEGSPGRWTGNVCTISCGTHRRKEPTGGAGVAAGGRRGRGSRERGVRRRARAPRIGARRHRTRVSRRPAPVAERQPRLRRRRARRPDRLGRAVAHSRRATARRTRACRR